MGNRARSELGPTALMAIAIFVGLVAIDFVFEGHAVWGEAVAVAILVPAAYYAYRLVRPRWRKG